MTSSENDDLYIWRVAVNILNKQSHTAGDPHALGLGKRLTVKFVMLKNATHGPKLDGFMGCRCM
jgi:hypothetical protein